MGTNVVEKLRTGPSEKISLKLIATGGAHQFSLPKRFHAFNHDAHSETVRQRCEGLNEHDRSFPRLDSRQKTLVDLESIHGEVFQITERGITCTEIVQRHGDAKGMYGRDHAGCLFRVVYKNAFG